MTARRITLVAVEQEALRMTVRCTAQVAVQSAASAVRMDVRIPGKRSRLSVAVQDEPAQAQVCPEQAAVLRTHQSSSH